MSEDRFEPGRDAQRFAIRGQVWEASDDGLQKVLAQIHESAERLRCLCVARGVDMYVACHQRYVVKRMPETGRDHHPSCPSWEPEDALSGLGDLFGDAVLENQPGRVELRVDFPWVRVNGRAIVRGEDRDRGETEVPRRRMSLRAVLHFLFERAGFNRWTPAMAGRRNQGVLHKYLLEATQEIEVKGAPLAERLYVPEPFSESAKVDIARRRRDKLAILQPRDGRAPMALVIGEFKAAERGDHGCRVWVRHMPDAPLLMETRSWDRLAQVQAPLFEARDADSGHSVRLILAALIHARREFTYEIDASTVMLVSEQWIAVDGVHELALIGALVERQRRFVKPLRYDAVSAAAFPNALLLDCGALPFSLHMGSDFLPPQGPCAEGQSAACRRGRHVALAFRRSHARAAPQHPRRSRSVGRVLEPLGEFFRDLMVREFEAELAFPSMSQRSVVRLVQPSSAVGSDSR